MADKRERRPGELVFISILIGFSLTAAWQAYEISGFSEIAGAGVFPMLATGTMIISALAILRSAFADKRPSTTSATLASRFLSEVTPLQLIVVIAMIIAYVVAMPLIGFVLSSGSFIFAMLIYLWRTGLVLSLIVSTGSLALIYLVFRILFQVVLPQGSLWQ